MVQKHFVPFLLQLAPHLVLHKYVFFVVVVVCLGLFLAELLINDASKKKVSLRLLGFPKILQV